MCVLLRKWKAHQLPDTQSIWFLKWSDTDCHSFTRCGSAALERMPTFEAYCCDSRRACWAASSDSIFLLAGCPEALNCLICFVILQGPSWAWWQHRIQELVCFVGTERSKILLYYIYFFSQRRVRAFPQSLKPILSNFGYCSVWKRKKKYFVTNPLLHCFIALFVYWHF